MGRVESDEEALHKVVAPALAAGVVDDVSGFRGEADGEGPLFAGCHTTDDVRIALQGHGHGLGGFLDLVCGDVGRPVVRHRGGGDKNIRLGNHRLDRIGHLERRFDLHGAHAFRRWELGRATDQNHPGSGFCRGFGNRMRQILPRQVRWLAERAEQWVPPEERETAPAEGGVETPAEQGG